MHRWMAGVALAVSLGITSGVSAENAGRPFERMGPEHWSYRAVQRLELGGYFTGSPEGTFNGTRRLTRYEFATALERIYRSLQPRVFAATEAATLPEDLLGFSVLLSEYAPELAGLGHDVDEMRRQVRAWTQRVRHLQQDASAAASPSLPESLAQPPMRGNTRRTFGFPGAFQKVGLLDGNSTPNYLQSPTETAPAVDAVREVGPVNVGLQLRGADPLESAPDLPFEDPAASLSYRAQMSLPLGRYLLGAFYSRDNGRSDRFGFWNPYFSTGASQGVGTSLSGPLAGRFGFGLETSRFQLEDDLARLVSFQGRLDYNLGGGFGLGFAISRMWQYGQAGASGDGTALTFGLGGRLGPNTQFNLLYRHFGANGAGGLGSSASFGDSGALGQLTVRF